MKSFALSLVVLGLMAGASLGQDCSSGVCLKPLNAVGRVVEAATRPVRVVVQHKPVRKVLGRCSARACRLLRGCK